jgi:hypothetical protein
MIGFSILRNLFDNVLQTKFVEGVYHSVMMKQDKEGIRPAAPVQDRWVYIGPDDTKGLYAYCRQTGSADVQSSERIGACNLKKYRFQVPHRIVFFHNSEDRDHEAIIAKITGAVMKTPFVLLQKIITIPDELLRSEAPTGKFKFKEKTLYFSIEFFVLLDLQTDTCEEEIKCSGIDNPYCTATN